MQAIASIMWTMREKRSRIEVQGIPIEVVRKNVKHVYFKVYSPDGRVRVTAPRRLDDEALRLAIVSRLRWIRRHQGAIQRRDPPPRLEMVTGEGHPYLGQEYRLVIVEHDGPPAVNLLDGANLEMRVRPGTDRDKREVVLDRWYRQRLRELIPPLIAVWEPTVGVTVAEWRIKKMKTRWGTCNIDARRIWLNLVLAKKPASCLEYIVVHEMVHLLERHHNGQFRAHMDRFLPQWRLQRDELNRGSPESEPHDPSR